MQSQNLWKKIRKKSTVDGDIPSMQEARGKIVLIRRFESNSELRRLADTVQWDLILQTGMM